MPTPDGRVHILNRLKSVDGHVRGVIKMVEDDVYCMDVIKQLQAIQSAIGKVNALLLQDHLQSCVTTAIRSDAPAERERVIGELLSLFEQGARLESVTPSPAAQLAEAVASALTSDPAASETSVPAVPTTNGQTHGCTSH